MAASRDLATDPTLQEALLTARRGTEFFDRKLNELPDDAFQAPSLLPDWTRAHVIAHVGYNARAIARLMKWANTGIETPMYSSWDARNAEIEHGATLAPEELRDLYTDSAAQLDAAWRDTPPDAWKHQVKTAQGRLVPASETVWMRTRETWIHAVDLNNGATFDQIPTDVLKRLLQEITGAWKSRDEDKDLLLKASDASTVTELGDLDSDNPEIITGTLADIAAFAAGRSTNGITSSKQQSPTAPRWL
ncbi:maleylpyruvate isomerase family mycothiol-dependent enzyme [Arthrobacter sp. VKM Ac-2550]|uniref:maleylpyruvate isomerase family mycothiol-dependent enzyme n=1 Tax=Crystallibacter permensis TaxID=1938888 RepID=UPI0022263613|nr:maleylpyruvate isomerase family mycothiol-dependent enzyme [Arthrobacter sp. VKM Ac-2550]MCW2131310.1 maleylpyruvate isomerase [Arthrobacter sp. VKM Ac-2550]